MNLNPIRRQVNAAPLGLGLIVIANLFNIFRVYKLNKMEILNPNLKIKQNDIEVKVVTRTKTSLQIKN